MQLCFQQQTFIIKDMFLTNYSMNTDNISCSLQQVNVRYANGNTIKLP